MTTEPTNIPLKPTPSQHLGQHLDIHSKHTRRKTFERNLGNRQKNWEIYPALKQQHQKRNTFYPRVVNNTDISFSHSELALLGKGLKYNIRSKEKNWIQNLALEVKTATTQLPPHHKMVADHIHTLQQNKSSIHDTHPEARQIKSLKTKLSDNKAMITPADKVNSLVILPVQQYKSKIQNFLHKNNFQTAPTDPTNSFQVQIRKTVKESKTLIPQDSK